MEKGAVRYSVGELAQLGGVNRRTVRYYVQRGLLPKPTGVGRGKHYTQEHLDALIQIRQLQEAGVSLDQIAARFAKPHGTDAAATQPPPPTHPPKGSGALTRHRTQWTRVSLADGLELNLRRDRFDIDDVRLGQLIDAVRRILDAPDVSHKEEESP